MQITSVETHVPSQTHALKTQSLLTYWPSPIGLHVPSCQCLQFSTVTFPTLPLTHHTEVLLALPTTLSPLCFRMWLRTRHTANLCSLLPSLLLCGCEVPWVPDPLTPFWMILPCTSGETALYWRSPHLLCHFAKSPQHLLCLFSLAYCVTSFLSSPNLADRSQKSRQ